MNDARTIFLRLSVVALLAISYFAAAKLGLKLAFVNISATAVWPPTGIALASLLVLGYRVWPGILLGAFFANVTTSGSVPASLLIAVGNTLEGLVGAYLINRFAHGRRVFDRPLDIVKFAVLAGMVSTSVSATVGVSSLALNDLAEWSRYGPIWFTWWIGDATGAVIVAPVLMLWAADWRVRWNRRQVQEAVLLLLLLIFAGLVAFSEWFPPGVHNYPVHYLVLPVIVWIAYRFGLRETATATIILSGIAVWGTLHGLGPFAAYTPNESLLLLQGFIGITALTTFVLAAVVAQRSQGEGALREGEERYRIIAESARDGFITIDTHSTIIYVNPAVESIFGYRVSEMIGQQLTMLMPEHLRHAHKQMFERYIRTGHKNVSWRGVEMPGLHRDGHQVPLEISFGEYHREGKHLFTGVVRDFTERKRAEESQRWLASITESSNDAIIGETLDGIIYSWNQAAERMYGYTAAEVTGHSISMLVPPDRPDEMPRLLERIRQGERIEQYETGRICKDGKQIAVSLTMFPIRDANGTITGAATTGRDITDRKLTEEFRYFAEHDPLTGLPNRVLFRYGIGQAIVQAHRNQEQVALLFLDLDGFKNINDSLGHQIGDRLLQQTATRLRHCLRKADTIARLGGDEFVISLTGLKNSKAAALIARKVVEALHKPFLIDKHETHVSASIGISVYPTDGEEVDALMRAADMAMYQAKENGRNKYQFFTPRLNPTVEEAQPRRTR